MKSQQCLRHLSLSREQVRRDKSKKDAEGAVERRSVGAAIENSVKRRT